MLSLQVVTYITYPFLVYPQYDWVGGVADLFATVDVTVDANDYVNVKTPDYFFQLGGVLDMFTPT